MSNVKLGKMPLLCFKDVIYLERKRERELGEAMEAVKGNGTSGPPDPVVSDKLLQDGR